MSAPELPNNLDDERAILTSIIRNREAIVPIAPWLDAGHFYREQNGWIYTAMLACFKARMTPNYPNIAAELRKSNRLEAIGGMDALLSLGDEMVESYDVESYARRVADASVKRQGIDVAGKIAAMFYDRATGGDDILASALNLLSSVKVSNAEEMFKPISVAVDKYYDKLARVLRGEASATGIQTGYRDLDEMTGGLHGDELTVIAARPSVGKTAFMLSIAYNIAQQQDTDVLVCSLEMSEDQLQVRMLAMKTRIDTHRLRMVQLNEREQQDVVTALPIIASMPVKIADISAMTADQIRLATIRHRSKYDRPVVVIVDYLQLMGSTRRHENRVQDVSEISRALKNLSRELHIPVIALSQLSRAVEGRTSHIPMLSDLRDSGSIEQDADNVWFIYREELYDKETDQKGMAQLHIAKHRQGPLGVVVMRFDAATTRFDTLTYRSVDGY